MEWNRSLMASQSVSQLRRLHSHSSEELSAADVGLAHGLWHSVEAAQLRQSERGLEAQLVAHRNEDGRRRCVCASERLSKRKKRKEKKRKEKKRKQDNKNESKKGKKKEDQIVKCKN